VPPLILRVAASSPELERGLDRIRSEFEVPTSFADTVQQAADSAARASADLGERVDERATEFVTIDPAGSRDLDQAYFASRQGDGIRVNYAIADVAAFVAAVDPVDAEAHRRGVTVYMPDERAPLYPDVIDQGAASLLPDQERPALLWTIDLGADGVANDWRLERATVRSRRAMTYVEAQREIDSGTGDPSLMLLRDIGRARKAQEKARGGVSLNLPAQELRPVKGGYELAYDTSLEVENWNAQVSLLAGLCAATTMIKAGVGILRTLPPPDEQIVARLRRSARVLGVAWPDGASYADVAGSLAPTTPGAAAFLTQATRALRGAGYTLVDATHGPPPVHSAIAAPYAHVTAPLRRLADRFANEIVVAATAGRSAPAWAVDGLAALPDVMQEGTHRAAGVERAVVDLGECLVLGGHVGETFRGTVVDVNDRGSTVQLTGPPIIAKLDGATAALGEEVSVKLIAAEPERRRVEFALA
jgi:exoribonuclease R